MLHFPNFDILSLSKKEKIDFLQNVDLTKVQFRVRIADFGFARNLGRSDRADTVCGTPLYMAPQVVDDQSYNFKADIWSLGIIHYELLTGKTPFMGSTMV